MISNADLTQDEVPAPALRYCKSGHVAPPVFVRDLGHPAEPTKFFKVNSQGNPSINGIYCEPCLIVAHHMARQQKSKGTR